MKYTIFGESHGPEIGVVLTGVPAGIALDWGFILSEMARRAPGQSALSTARKEADTPEVVSGVFEGKTTGAPLCAIIQNTDTRSRDYEELRRKPRPSHADYAAFVASGGFRDYRGGGHFSGRLTAPLVFAGAVAKQVLKPRGITVSARISMLGGVKDPSQSQIEDIVLSAKQAGDSVGGTIACTVEGMPAGLGAPDFGCNVEGIFSQYLFAVPAVKGVAFGAGFALASMRGSEANDPFYMDGDTVKTRTNHAGGVNGGITNGMPITFEAVLRPTTSIYREQDTVDLDTGSDTKLIIHGRHDPCIVPRAVVVIEAAAALASCEVLERGAWR